MIVKTKNPIREVNVNVKPNGSFSYADSTTTPATTKKEKKGFFSKARRAERKADRIKTREERREKRAKYGARPLNPFTEGGKKFWKDNLPKLRKRADGDFEKTMPDGTRVVVKGKDVTIFPAPANNKNAEPAAIETKDLKTSAAVVTNVVDGAVQVSKKYSENQTEKALDENGVEQVYKKEDVVDANSSEAKKPMSTTTKVLLGIGVAAVLGLGIYFATKKNK